ncbi:hypothetical protein [Arthrobacter sp. zg-Y238]|uniref:hypothetical protein n=1 Tax=Arthrobacter sp. zg-Y238 TaxID=2964614 RepID=UPI0021085813|nr:hypothetical protein [Arthrobacter sp. zg-Y238]MCQ1954741.1 hypothetical protein [Arthrobacter sp. zg-Y238]
MKNHTNVRGESAAGTLRRWHPLAGAIAAGALAAGGLAALSLTAPSAQALEPAPQAQQAEATAAAEAEDDSQEATAQHNPAVDSGHGVHAPGAQETAAAESLPSATPEPSTTPEASASPESTPTAEPSHEGHEPSGDSQYSTAYTERNWTPTAYDTCSKELHASYTALGPDGKIYPTWHPAQVTDPATGTLCTFGHEHGADPASSDIYGWVVDHLTPEDTDGGKTGIPFGYASEALMTYGASHEGMAMRHEDNAGHKIFIANDVQLIDEFRDWVTIPGTQEIVTCDFLIKQHQGSWSPDATSNNAHEAIYASRCSDGTEIISTTLSKFGNSNEFHQTCGTLGPVATVGSKLPMGYGGLRQIPDAECVAKNATGNAASLWGMYELWKGENKIMAADGQTELAHFDPWFGLRNPSRYYNPANSTATTNGISRPVDLAWGDNAATTYPWNTVAASVPLNWQDPASPFDGAQRDFYLTQNKVAAGTPATVYTDPYGAGATETEFPGSIRQHLVSGSATTTANLSTQKFDTDADYGHNNGVHAPN